MPFVIGRLSRFMLECRDIPGINTPNDLSKRIDDFATVPLCYRDQITQLAQNSSDDTYHDTYRATMMMVYTFETLPSFRINGLKGGEVSRL